MGIKNSSAEAASYKHVETNALTGLKMLTIGTAVKVPNVKRTIRLDKVSVAQIVNIDQYCSWHCKVEEWAFAEFYT